MLSVVIKMFCYFSQAYCYIISGRCFAVGLRFAGSSNKSAYDTLVSCLLYILPVVCIIYRHAENIDNLVFERLQCLNSTKLFLGSTLVLTCYITKRLQYINFMYICQSMPPSKIVFLNSLLVVCHGKIHSSCSNVTLLVG